MTHDERIAAALRDLAECGWVHVPSQALAEEIARAAEQAGRRVRIERIDGGWRSVEEVPEHVGTPHPHV